MRMRAIQIAIALTIAALPQVCCGDGRPTAMSSTVLARAGSVIGARAATVSGIEGDDQGDLDTGVAASCDFVKIKAHPDPSVLLREFLKRDSFGEFLQGDKWFDGATECPGHEGGRDRFNLIAGYAVTKMVVRGSSAKATVRYHVLGEVSVGRFFERIRTLTRQIYTSKNQVMAGNSKDRFWTSTFA